MGSLLQFFKSMKSFLKKPESPFVKNYLYAVNIRSSIFVSVIVALLEIWMLVMMICGVIKNSGSYTFEWLLIHTLAYLGLLVISLVMLVHSVLYINKKKSDYTTGTIIRVIFSIAMLAFGLYISYTSKDRGGQVFAFITVIIFVNCIFVWKPLVSFLTLTAVFIVYIYLQRKIINISLSIKVNAFTTWLAFCVTALNSYHQRRIEAEKDEQLNNLNSYHEKKSWIDELTLLPNMNFFYKKSVEILQDEKTEIPELGFIFIDVENFKNYNEKYGFFAGTQFLKTIAAILKDIFKDELLARFSDDHFVVLGKIGDINSKVEAINSEIKKQEDSVQLGIKVGICRVQSRDDSPYLACDRSRYASESIKKHFGHDIAEFDSEMNKVFNQKQYIINNLNHAIEKGQIKVYYQPVVWAKNKKLCGVEALARWEDPVFGRMPPCSFIPILEEYHLIHILDKYIMETACKDVREQFKKNSYVVPVSINLSRLDFELMDPAVELERCIKKYDIARKDVHVEITETALSSNDDKLKKILEAFRNNGNSLWLDDFGSGYSGLNVLKDFTFDLMKIDMVFLSKFDDNEKSQPILKSIVNLAQKIGMQTLTEGVETQAACDFLSEIGCQRLQGYLFGKPMPVGELISKIKDRTYEIDV